MKTPSKDMDRKMFEVLITSPRIISLWDKVISDEINQEDKNRTFDLMIRNFVTLRMKSYASAHQFVIGRKDIAKKHKSLRHHLE